MTRTYREVSHMLERQDNFTILNNNIPKTRQLFTRSPVKITYVGLYEKL